ncbi:MAG: TonB family protein [Bacteriovoracia bacterium]
MDEKVVVLTIKTKDSNEKTLRIHKPRIVIGSATSADVKLENVSPIHAIIEVAGFDGKPVIYDLASETGIKVNGESTIQTELKPDDKIRIGDYQIQFKLQKVTDIPKAPARVRESFGQTLFVNEKEDLAPLILEEEANVIDIFDRSPESKKSLQVVMFYNETILDIEHFVNEKAVVIGPKGVEDFGIPPFLGEGRHGRFELVTNQNGQYVLHLNNQMDGVISRNGKLESLRELSAAVSTNATFSLGEKDFAKVKLNDISFFINFSPAPPKLKMQRILDRDPFFLKIWLFSLAITAFTVFSLSRMEVDPKIEIEQLPERMATIIYEPKLLPIERPKVETEKVKPVEKPKEEPKIVEKTEKKVIKLDLKPKKLKPTTSKPTEIDVPNKAHPATKPHKEAKKEKEQPKKVVSKPAQKKHVTPRPEAKHEVGKAAGNEGEGAKAKGPEGGRGKPNARADKTAQNKALRPGETKNLNAPVSTPGHSQVQSMGVVDVFKSNKGALAKILAAGRGGSNSLSNLEGYSGFTTKGDGGLGEAGAGSGGGGKSLGLGGLSNKGSGGGKKGSGLGALGSGGNLLGGTGKLAVQSGGVSEPIVLGAIDEDAIRRAIEAHRDEIKYCYEKEINAENPDLSGRVAVRWVIGASGTVTNAGIASSSMKNANVEGCVVAVIRRIPFPPVRGGGIAEVTYPFVFKPANR